MPEHTSPQTLTVPTRLKSAVRARSLAEEGVALSMGATAVIVRGAQAETVWRALESTLRTGFERATLLERFPERGRPFLEGILDQLEEHGFLRDLEPELVDPSPVEQAAYAHLESLTRRPYAALNALRQSTAWVRSSSPPLTSEVVRALKRAGFGQVHVDPSPVPKGPILLTTRLESADGEGAEHLIATGRGLWSVGPRNRPLSPDLSERLLAWFAGLEGEHRVPDQAALRLTRTLVAAQLALALVAHVARTAEGTIADLDPEFMVTTDELVSEPHTFLLADPLDPTELERPPAPDPAEPPEVPELLDSITHLWDRVFGPVAEPRPGELPQLPVGLALAGDVAGCGLTTAQARLDALLGALHRVVWLPTDALVGRGLGSTSVTAIGAAVGDLLQGLPEERWKDVDAPDPSPTARRLWAALTLRSGVPAKLVLRRLDGSGPHRAQVFARSSKNPAAPERPLAGTSVAADVDSCVQEALIRAVAATLLTQEAPHAALPAPATGTDMATASLARWAFETGAVRVSAPKNADRWRGLGVHSAVATWN